MENTLPSPTPNPYVENPAAREAPFTQPATALPSAPKPFLSNRIILIVVILIIILTAGGTYLALNSNI